MREGGNVTRDELLEKYNRLAADTPIEWLAAVYKAVLADLRVLEREGAPVSYNTNDAARACGVAPKTIAHWCEAGRFPQAFKTSEGRGGQWVIPAGDIDEYHARKARIA